MIHKLKFTKVGFNHVPHHFHEAFIGMERKICIRVPIQVDQNRLEQIEATVRYRSITTSFLHAWYHDKTTSTPHHVFAWTTFPRSMEYTRLVWKHTWNSTVRGRTRQCKFTRVLFSSSLTYEKVQ